MTVVFLVEVGGETHRIRVDLPADQGPKAARDIKRFAVIAAYLEHCGYLPRGVVHTID